VEYFSGLAAKLDILIGEVRADGLLSTLCIPKTELGERLSFRTSICRKGGCRVHLLLVLVNVNDLHEESVERAT